MNPPYGGKHLPILEKVTREVVQKNKGKVISLQPIRWLQDPLQDFKDNKQVQNTKNMIKNYVSNIKEIHVIEARKYFESADLTMHLGLFSIEDTKKNFDLNDIKKRKIGDIRKRLDPPLDISWIMKVVKLNNLKNSGLKIEIVNKNTKHFVPFAEICGGHGAVGDDIRRLNYGYYTNKKSNDALYGDNKTIFELKSKSSNQKTGHPENWKVFVFRTANEAKNFYNYLGLKSFRFFVYVTSLDVHIQTGFLPWTNDYTKSWTDEQFYEYFKINKKEQKIIEKWAKEFNIA
jgi:hypothetical protein